MDLNYLYHRCTNEFEEGFAMNLAREVLETNSAADFFELLDFAVQHQAKEAKLCFRGFYVLEAIYLLDEHLTVDQWMRLFEWIPKLKNRSAHRHVSKLLAIELAKNSKGIPSSPLWKCIRPGQWETCIESLGDWLIDPDSKIAVQVWSLEALLVLQQSTAKWKGYQDTHQLLVDIVPYCTDLFLQHDSAGKKSRVRQWTERGLM